MKLRIAFLIPAVLVVTALVGDLLMFSVATQSAADIIRREAQDHLRLDISQLQNILYNSMTGDQLNDARLSLSITAMDADFQRLLVTDETDRVMLANRYLWEGVPAGDISRYESDIAHQVMESSQPVIARAGTDDALLVGYFPVVLQLESEQGLPIKRMGVLYAEYSTLARLAAARQQALTQSRWFGGVMLMTAILVALLLHFLISRRLVRLTGASVALAGGDLETRVTIRGNDELALLGDAFDDMAARIKQDIQHRQTAEEQLRKLNETLEERVAERTALLQEAQRIAHLGNWRRELGTDALSWSDEIYRIFGYRPGEFEPTQERFLAALAAEDVARLHAAEELAIREGTRQSIDFPISLPDGEQRWVHKEVVPWRASDGTLCGLSGTMQDVTERKRIEQSLVAAKEEAETASHAKSEFLSRMSHELRTPMNAILGFSQVLEMGELNAEQRQHVHEIRHAGDHLLDLINDLLDLSRIEAGRLTTVLEAVDVASVVRDSVNIVKPLLEQKQLTLHVRCAEKRSIIADRTHLRQVLVNLLANAVKYNREHGSITVECELHGDRVRLLVRDTGIGIEAGKIPSLFKPFERLGAEYTGIEGTGIGLALSKLMMELMGGSIGVESKPGEGSSFWIELPGGSAGQLAEGDADMENDAVSAKKYQVLYIEDNAANLALVKAILKHHPQMTFLSATNGEHGLQLARRYLPDVILLDINLPDIDGYRVLRELQADVTTRAIPVVALSADAMPLDIERGRAAGFRDYLTKPVRVDALIRALSI